MIIHSDISSTASILATREALRAARTLEASTVRLEQRIASRFGLGRRAWALDPSLLGGVFCALSSIVVCLGGVL